MWEVPNWCPLLQRTKSPFFGSLLLSNLQKICFPPALYKDRRFTMFNCTAQHSPTYFHTDLNRLRMKSTLLVYRKFCQYYQVLGYVP